MFLNPVEEVVVKHETDLNRAISDDDEMSRSVWEMIRMEIASFV
jgi:hypothetical protein